MRRVDAERGRGADKRGRLSKEWQEAEGESNKQLVFPLLRLLANRRMLPNSHERVTGR